MSLRLKCGQKPPQFFFIFYNKAMVPVPATPSPSEHGEWLDSQYELAWNLWLLASSASPRSLVRRPAPVSVFAGFVNTSFGVLIMESLFL